MDASADDRDTRGLTSITAYSVESGESANWTLQPPSTPSARMIASAAERSRWWTWSVSVWTGATTIESPVCTPSGSTFSIEHTAMHVSSASRMTSYSISCQPTRQRSIITCLIGLARRPARTRSQYASSVSTMPPPVPPSVNAGRMIAGSPIVGERRLRRGVPRAPRPAPRR